MAGVLILFWDHSPCDVSADRGESGPGRFTSPTLPVPAAKSLLACFPEYIGFSYGVSFVCCTALPAAFHPLPLNFFLHNRSEPLTFLLKNI